jgi:hypothetical protein
MSVGFGTIIPIIIGFASAWIQTVLATECLVLQVLGQIQLSAYFLNKVLLKNSHAIIYLLSMVVFMLAGRVE